MADYFKLKENDWDYNSSIRFLNFGF